MVIRSRKYKDKQYNGQDKRRKKKKGQWKNKKDLRNTIQKTTD